MNVTANEMAAIVEALFEALSRRLKWCVTPDNTWESLEWQYAKEALNELVQAYTKVFMTLKEVPDVHPEFIKMMTFDDEAWDLINRVTLADSWDDVPSHELHDPSRCTVCAAFLLV